MTPNEGLQDRIIRCMIGLTVTVGALIIWVAVPLFSATGIMNMVFLLFGVEVLATGVTGWSPIYALIGFSTNGRIGGCIPLTASSSWTPPAAAERTSPRR